MAKFDLVEEGKIHAPPNGRNVKARKPKKKVYKPSEEYRPQKHKKQKPEKQKQVPERQTPEKQTPEKQTPEKQTPERQMPERQTAERQKPEKSKGAAPKRRVGFLIELLYLVIKIVAIVLAFMLMFTFVFGIFRSADPAMSPAIRDGDLVFFYRLDKDYIPSDTLVLEYEGEKQVRRVIATAGDLVDIKEDGLYINGARQQEMLIYEETQRFDTGIEFPLTVKRGEVFVLGDSRTVATDSRFYGAVKIDYTLGKVMTIIRRRGI